MSRVCGRSDAKSDAGTLALVDRIGVTYRRIDYWIRTGTVEIADPPRGSGVYRNITDAEAAAIADVAAEIEAINARMATARSGEFFRQRLAVHSQLRSA